MSSTQAIPMTYRISDRALARTQAASGLVFAVFLVLHLATAASSIGGEDAYNGVLAAVRHYYRFPLIEIAAVLSAALVHMASGAMRFWRRRREQRGKSIKVPLRLRLHRYTGYYLMAAFSGHVVATRAPSLIWGQDPNFGFLSLSLHTAPYFFYPYYALLAFSGGYHLVHGIFAALKVLRVKLPGRTTSPRSPIFWGYAALWSLIAIGIVLAFGGILFHVDPAHVERWHAFANRVLPFEI